MLCHVNLIPVNRVRGSSFEKSGQEALRRFLAVLTRNGISATVRRTLGADIDASCGQLRRRYQEEVSGVESLQ